ncbi:MAG: type II secretion system F family protein [Peptococcaceae bacterium]|nr:type II secretion system F family protein [Peptococcaceae bacterium]
MSRKIRLAGNPWGITPYELKLIKYAAALLCGGTSLGTGYLLHLSNILNITLMPLMCYVGWLLPEIYLNARAKSRQNEVERSLPDVLDLLTVSIEAGLGFDAALLKVVEKSKGVLADELKEMINEVQMGKPRLEALRDMADRVGVEDLSSFVGAVVMAEQMGVRLGNVLRTQSDQIRLKRRQRAEEMAFKAPVKMLLPLVFLIFPATFIVLLGPAVIRIMSVFGG